MTTPDGIAAYQAYREGLEAAPGACNPYSGRPVLAAMWLRGHQTVTDKTITDDKGEYEMSSTYTTRNDALRAIATAIESSVNIQNAFIEYDVDAIAENVIIEVTDDAGRLIGYQVTDNNELFWSTVERHALLIRAQEIVDRLNAYEASHAADDYSDKPINNIWQDVIVRLDEYDQDATEQAGDDTIILRDGSVIRWDEQRGEWYVA